MLCLNNKRHPFCDFINFKYQKKYFIKTIRKEPKMIHKIKQVNFSNQQIFIGIDVHKKQWAVTIIISGIIVKKFSMNPSPEELSKYVKKNYPGGEYISVYEAGYSGYWIDRQLRVLGIKNIVVSPADVPTSNKEKTGKTDRTDSKKLARELSVNNLSGIYIPTEEQEAHRALNRLRMQLSKDQVRIKNRIKSLLNYIGINLSANSEMQYWSRRLIDYISKIEFKEESMKKTINYLIKELLNIREQIKSILLEQRRIINENEEMQRIIHRLMSVSGVGFITATAFYFEIMDINRFNNVDSLDSYIGFVPSLYSSGEKELVLGLTKRGKNYLRNYIIEASWSSIRTDTVLMAAYSKLTRRMTGQKAIIRIAKKLVKRMMHVWKYDEDYIKSTVIVQ